MCSIINPLLVPVVDVFAGAGGLGEGFVSWPERAEPFFRMALSVEKNAAAVRTLRLRAFFRMFQPGHVPEEYYRFVRGGSVSESLLKYLEGNGVPPHRDDAGAACDQVWLAALGEKGFSADELDRRVSDATGGREDWVLIGGPPCQPFSTAGRTRRRSIPGFDPEADERNFLYKEYLRVISSHWPAVFVMENVTGIISARLGGEPVLKQVLKDLSDPARLSVRHAMGGMTRYRYAIWPLVQTTSRPDLFGVYKPEQYVIEAERYGIPQKRHRVILLGIRDDIQVDPRPLVPTCGSHLTVENILYGIPALRSGIARTPDSRQQWGDIASGHPPPGGWRGAELNDVVDSPEQWSAILRSSVSRSWFAELRDLGQTDVRDYIAEVVGGLTVPRDDRGSDCVPGGKPPSALRDWYEDPRLRAVCNHNSPGAYAAGSVPLSLCGCFC